jgi:hypothetical protein
MLKKHYFQRITGEDALKLDVFDECEPIGEEVTAEDHREMVYFQENLNTSHQNSHLIGIQNQSANLSTPVNTSALHDSVLTAKVKGYSMRTQ